MLKSERFFVRLGAALGSRLGVGPKAASLDRAAAAGLPVPDGLIVLDELFGESLRQGWLQAAEGRFVLHDVATFERALNLPVVSPRLAVRSAFAVEDGATKSLAGYFDSVLNVAPQDVATALCEVWCSSLRHAAPHRRDVIVMAMVDARWAGVAATETDHEDDLINVTEGLADDLVGGRVPGETRNLPKINAFEGPTESGFAGRLQVLLRDVRRVFGRGNWDVEFADDGRRCWLLQVRPLTQPVTRNEWFTYANHREILPPLPSRLMTSLIASCAQDLFDYYRDFDARLPANRPFIEVFAGRPFINLSLLADMMRLWGLPTRLVTDAIGGRDVFGQGLRWGRLWRSWRALVRLGWAQLQSVGSAQNRIAWLAQVGQASDSDNFTTCLTDLQTVYTALVREMFSLTQAISGPMAALRRLGLLSEWAARHETITTRLMTDLDPLRDYVQAHPSVVDVLRRGGLPHDETFRQLWQDYLARYGFRGIFESDIAQPRYHEQPEVLLASLWLPRGALTPPPLPWFAWLVYPVWWQARRALDARERLRHAAMQTFDRLRQRLKRLAEQACATGALPAAEDVWLLEVDELKRLDGGWRVTPDFLATRREEQARFAEYDFPDVFQRFDDFTAFIRARAGGDLVGQRLPGIGLTRGTAEGRAWVCDTPTLPPGDTDEPYILVARAVDAGWIPVFAAVAGVVVEIGGDLSHGSIVLRELGLPSVTNVRGVTRVIQTGDRIRVQASEGAVEVLKSGVGAVSLASTPAHE
ncbi:MAG: PEP-utilizing enzyme [Chloracidobacterium sp.]|uniref:Phosphoenolpyruvate synthase n=1 Tax=Chloracidobacterium validum TaxID=2821543 RepID=A0ABX8BGH6_9BACT|nr:PEP-utilizing enzyme [Chloracidobacterium validum]QUW04185.1 hypothetical protein J8C06_14175 [Chloracidobacterium validum]